MIAVKSLPYTLLDHLLSLITSNFDASKVLVLPFEDFKTVTYCTGLTRHGFLGLTLTTIIGSFNLPSCEEYLTKSPTLHRGILCHHKSLILLPRLDLSELS